MLGFLIKAHSIECLCGKYGMNRAENVYLQINLFKTSSVSNDTNIRWNEQEYRQVKYEEIKSLALNKNLRLIFEVNFHKQSTNSRKFQRGRQNNWGLPELQWKDNSYSLCLKNIFVYPSSISFKETIIWKEVHVILYLNLNLNYNFFF